MTPVSSTLPELLQAALRYAAAGFRVFPCHSAMGVRCSCPTPHCKTPGKHPRIKDWPDRASADVATINDWWKKWPDSNIGMRTGDGVVVIDIDPDKGGNESFAQLLLNQEPLPVTPESVTGSGGRHLLFSYAPDNPIPNAQGIVPGIDVRGDGGFIVVPPSVHASQRSYEWASGRSPELLPIAPLPEWLGTLIRARARVKWKQSADEPIIDGERHIVLTSIAGTMRIRGLDDDAILAALTVMNAKRCVPPMDEVELKIIATSMMKYRGDAWSGQIADDGAPDPENYLRVDGSPVVAPAPQHASWEQELTYDKHGNVKGTVAGNAALLLANLPAWRGCLQFDAFNNRIDWMKSPPTVAGLGIPAGEFADHHVLYVQQWLARHRGVEFAKGHTQDAIISAARKNWIHPLQDYLNSLGWDGVPRLSSWLTTYLGADRNDYTKAVGEWWAISAVARAMQPGCQVDHMLILEGRQGCGKSTAVRILGGQWFLGSLPDLKNAERAADALNGHWIIEMGELDAMRGSAMTRTKNFLTQPVDTYRAAYARFKETHKRSCVFIGTTNEANYLRDATGARRFWPVRVVSLNRKGLIKDRDQLWAEALYMYRNGAEWHPTAELVSLLKDEQDSRYEADPWEELIDRWLKDSSSSEGVELTSGEIATKGLQMDASRYDHAVAARIGRCMQRLGYVHRPAKDSSRKSIRLWESVLHHEIA